MQGSISNPQLPSMPFGNQDDRYRGKLIPIINLGRYN
jgi:hypothetical protein